MLIQEKATGDFLKLLFFLPSTTDQKEKINKFFRNVNLHPIDCSYEDFSNYAVKNNIFYPQHLDSRIPNKREAAKEIVLNLF